MRKFSGFDENGYLPHGMYNMTFDELEEIFSKGKTKRRKEIMSHYERHLTEIRNSGYCLDHWIGGSFATSKENPNDIDTLTEFDGLEVDKNNDRSLIDDLIFNSKSRTNGYCHSLRVYRYPYYEKEDYKFYISAKLRIITELFAKDKNGIRKGVIHLIGGIVDEI